MGLGVQSRLPLGALALITFSGICAAALMFWITARGPGVSPDSVIYIETARSLLAGNGFSAEGKPMTHYPPVYPLLLAVVGLFNHGDVVHAGRLIGALLFGVNLALLGLALLAWSNRGSSAAAWGMLVFLASAPIIKTHPWRGPKRRSSRSRYCLHPALPPYRPPPPPLFFWPPPSASDAPSQPVISGSLYSAYGLCAPFSGRSPHETQDRRHRPSDSGWIGPPGILVDSQYPDSGNGDQPDAGNPCRWR